MLNDFYLLVPNALGCALGVVSLALVAVYSGGAGIKKSESAMDMLPNRTAVVVSPEGDSLTRRATEI